MGCCQPVENLSYDFSSDSILKSYHLSSSTQYYRQSYVNPTTSLLSPRSRKPPLLNDFQTPTERSNRKNGDWSPKSDSLGLLEAYARDDVAFLMEQIGNEDAVNESMKVEVRHRWTGEARTVGALAMVLATEVLAQGKEKGLKTLLLITDDHRGFLLLLLNETLVKRAFYALDHILLLLWQIVHSISGKDAALTAKLMIEVILIFNAGFKNRKLEQALLALEILAKLEGETQVNENCNSVMRTLYLVDEMAREMYSPEEQLLIAFREIAFLDGIHQNSIANTVDGLKKAGLGGLVGVIEGKVLEFKGKGISEGLQEYIHWIRKELLL